MIRQMSTVLTVTTAVMLSGSSATHADRLRNVKVGDQMPAFALKTIDGQTMESRSLKGKAAVIVFIAAEQASSEKAVRAAHNVAASLRKEQVQLLFVSADIVQSAYFRAHRDKTNIHDPLAFDVDREFYGKLGLIVLPTTLIVDRAGKLAVVMSGYKSDYPHVLDARVRHTLGLIDDEELAKLLAAKAFVRDRPEDRAARHRAAARLLRQKGLLKDAEDELAEALKLDPTNADTQLDLADIHLLRDKIAEAAAIVDAVLKADPNHRRGKLVHGIVLFRQNNLDTAEKVLQEALLLNPDPARTHYYLGKLHEKKGDKDKALHHYRQALQRVMGE